MDVVLLNVTDLVCAPLVLVGIVPRCIRGAGLVWLAASIASCVSNSSVEIAAASLDTLYVIDNKSKSVYACDKVTVVDAKSEVGDGFSHKVVRLLKLPLLWLFTP